MPTFSRPWIVIPRRLQHGNSASAALLTCGGVKPAAVRFGQAEAFQDLERPSNQNAQSLECPSLRRVLVRATGLIRRAPPFKRQIASSQTARTELLTL
jgi:hypothetical protein